jgi:hypothetical protein
MSSVSLGTRPGFFAEEFNPKKTPQVYTRGVFFALKQIPIPFASG